MKRLSFILIFLCIASFFIGSYEGSAETFRSELYGFTIKIPDDWVVRPPKKSWTLFTYAKLGSGENLNMNVFNAKGLHSIKKTSPKKTFYPYYEHIEILWKNYEKVDGIDVFKFIFTG